MRSRFGWLLVALLALPSTADAASGTLRGYWQFYQNQGNYCDASGGQTCNSASRYTEDEFNTYQRIKNSKVYIKDQNDVVIGSGVTSSDGYFNVNWFRVSTPTFVRVFWQLEHKDDRFRVRDSTGGTYAYWTPNITVTNGANQYTGTWNVGSSGSPSGIANIYDGADRMWYDALNYSGKMQAVFTNLEIRAYPTDCPTACAKGPENRIHMPSGAEFRPQARILHEMGHIASYKSNPRRMSTGYNYPTESLGGGSWSFTTNEWRSAALEEGRATFFGDVAFYWSWATDPRTCNSTGPCTTSIEAGISCSGTVGRRALQMDRYMWDIYDTVNDGETVSANYYAFFDTLGSIPNGFDWGEDESGYVNAGTNSIDAWDSFHSWEWRYAMLVHYSGAIDTQTPYFNNCMGWF